MIAWSAPQEPVVFFLHLPRTAGTTLARVLERQYSSAALLSVYDSDLESEIARTPPDRLQRIRAVTGHFYFGADRLFGRPSVYVTVLRDPVDRVVSHYYYVRADPGHYLHDAASRLSLCEYVISCGAAEPNNDQTRLLCGEYQGRVPERCTEEMLPQAMTNLRNHVAVVGLTEDFDRSLILMKRVLGWKRPFYVRHNMASQRLGKDQLSQEALGVIRTHNQLDIRLYEAAATLFGQQVSAAGDSLESELRAFRRLNSVVAPAGRLASSVVRRLRPRQ